MAIEMSMKLSPKQAGKLYQRRMKQEDSSRSFKKKLFCCVTFSGKPLRV
ncbi:hypothetical protein [Endozoicomonas sp. SESOKO4]|nr:hypothetical protein [Endozoicomonas sp. SESOKO4]